jgi:hypothetical protein
VPRVLFCGGQKHFYCSADFADVCVSQATYAPPNRHDWPKSCWQYCEGDGIMAYDADGDLLNHLLSKQQRRYVERRSSSQGIVPAVKMLVGDWYTDELGVVTREVRARD